MKWKKLGCIYNPYNKKNHQQLLTHAANPIPVYLGNDIFRIYYSGRDNKNRSSVGMLEYDIVKMKINKLFFEPVFCHGVDNNYFSHGVSVGCTYDVNDKKFILFMGWHIPRNAHWRGEIGRLLVNDNGSLSINDKDPFIPISPSDPISLSYPFVYQDKNDKKHMWYGSTKSWDAGNGEMLHVIKYASSIDGKSWVRKGLAIPYEIGKAQAFSRPTVIKNKRDGFNMWFSYRPGDGTSYRIGYAKTDDKKKWIVKNDQAGIDVSNSGWDSEMICYPYVFSHKDKRYMIYNGNGYGETGFGLAVLIEDE